MKKLNFKELFPKIKKELLLCIALPLMIAIVLGVSPVRDRSFVPMIIVALFFAVLYGVVRVFLARQRLKDELAEQKRLAVEAEQAEGVPQEDSPQRDAVAVLPTWRSSGYLAFVLIVSVFLPLLGLLINSGFIFDEGGILGDFSNIWFYLIAAANGVLMLVPIRANRRSFLVLTAKMMGLAFIIYFVIVFVPILPFALMGLPLFGLGVLILTPAAIFVTEVLQIVRDVKILKTRFSLGLIVIAMLVGFATIPAALTADFAISGANYNRSLSYLNGDAEELPWISRTRLEGTLDHIDKVQRAPLENQDIWLGSGLHTPLLSQYYHLIALNDKMPSPDTVERLRQVFFGTDTSNLRLSWDDAAQLRDVVKAANISTRTEFDESLGVYKTWIDLEVKNQGQLRFSEYRTEFTLPDGCFVTDYYLNVNGERKQGILADKRAALTTYESIIRTPRDPGILYYTGDSTLTLRVYPFAAYELRETGFLVWHSQSESITIDGIEVALTVSGGAEQPIELPGVTFIPAAAKDKLPTMTRTPAYYFVIDASENSPCEQHLSKMADYIRREGISATKIYAASYRVTETNLAGKGLRREGGFNLPLAITQIFRDVEDGSFPIIIAVSDNIYNAPSFARSQLARRFPESPYYYNLGYDLSLTPYSFVGSNRGDIVFTPTLARALDYKGLPVADDGKSETVVSGEIGGYTDNAYHNALLLYGKGFAYGDDRGKQLELVRDSFRQRVLSRHSAFTVLETKEQEIAMLELQAKLLSGYEKEVDAETVTPQMDEPDWIVCTLMLFAFVVCGKKYAARKRKGVHAA